MIVSPLDTFLSCTARIYCHEQWSPKGARSVPQSFQVHFSPAVAAPEWALLAASSTTVIFCLLICVWGGGGGDLFLTFLFIVNFNIHLPPGQRRLLGNVWWWVPLSILIIFLAGMGIHIVSIIIPPHSSDPSVNLWFSSAQESPVSVWHFLGRFPFVWWCMYDLHWPKLVCCHCTCTTCWSWPLLIS